jgi:branched-chain amino acid aminotransferase
MPQYAYYHKQFMPLADASMNIMTNFIHYGTGVFEGIRGNWNPDRQQIYLFRLKEHYERLMNGCRLLKMKIPYTIDDLCKNSVELVARSGLKEDLYIRPLAYKSSESLGVRLHNLEDDYLAFVIPWGPYLDTDTCRVGVSSWRRPGGNFSAPQAKLTGQYVNGAFAKTEAHDNGFDEAIVLNDAGHVAEGSGENIFLVIDGKLVTPGIYECALTGITRNTVIELAKNEMGLETLERPVDRSELYTAQEAFFTGTATHVVAIGEVDHRPVADGKMGPITTQLCDLYMDVIRGKHPKYMKWCTPVYK